MKQILQYPKKGKLCVEDVPIPSIREGGIVVRNACSLVSSGTERAVIDLAEKSIVSKARSRPDLVKQVFEKVRSEGLKSTYNKAKSRLDSPIPLGYSSAGVVEEISPELSEFAVGERVACAGFGYASHAEMIFVPKNLAVHLPQSVSFTDGSFVTLGAIAMQGVRQANVTLGENVAVFGLGLLGQLTIQMLKASGCRVIGLDIDQEKLNLAIENGVDLAVDNSSSSFERDVTHFTGGTGADKVIITAATSSSKLMSQAAAIARDKGHITVVGAVGMDLDRKPFYDKELSLNLSRSYGPGRYDRQYEEMGVDYPLAYVRWTEKRNMAAFLDLVASGSVKLDRLVSHTFKSADAVRAYDIVTGRVPENHLGIILEYPDKPANTVTSKRVNTPIRTVQSPGKLVVGAVGSGGFATGVMFPIIRNCKNLHPKWIAAPNGIKSVTAARQFGFQNATTEYEEILSDPAVGAVMIFTPHYLHASQITRALEAGKWVFVEKPLATTEDELEEILKAMDLNPAQVMVGFNRRYAPGISEIRSELESIPFPALLNYRINAGFIPKESPYQDDKIGKGRIIGEVCHFIDLMAYVTGANPTDVFAVSAQNGGQHYLNSDNVQISVKLSDGSIGNITYAANGGNGLPKERLEVFSGGVSFVVDDFKRVERYSDGRVKKLYKGAQDKGHRNEIRTFVDRYIGGNDLSSDFETAVAVTRATFAALKSLSSGSPQKI